MKLGMTSYEGLCFAIPITGAMELVNEIIRNGDISGTTSSITSGRPMLGITGRTVVEGQMYTPYDISYIEVTVGEAETDEEGASVPGSEKYYYVPDALTGPVYITEDQIVYFDKNGILVVEVQSWSSALNVLQRGDIILEYQGTKVTTINQLITLVNEGNIGDEVSLKIYRDGEEKTVKMILKANES